MENKQSKPRNKILKFLPKAASAVSVSFQNQSLPFSPGKHKCFAGKGFSGPMIPAEARSKSRTGTFDTQEPTSPKVSCMGQIKHKKSIKNIKKGKRISPPKIPSKPPKSTTVSESSSSGEVVKKKHHSKLRRIFSMGKQTSKKHDDDDDEASKLGDNNRAPSLGQMRRFASGRDAFASFDWTTQIAPVDQADRRDYYSDNDDADERRENSEFFEDDEEDMIIPFSAPISIGGGVLPLQPRKEINIWKRRTMNPPRPLQLNPN